MKEVLTKPDLLEQQAKAYTTLMESCGEDPTRQGLKDTATRAAKAFQHMTQGYHTDIDALVNAAMFDSDMSEMIMVKDIEFYSLCEHHILPFFGRAHVAYIPDGKVIGLSKVARIVDAFARRLQIQEQLSEEIANCLMHYTKAKGVGVIIEAKHMCMMMRGVNKQNASMTSSVMLGQFRSDQRTRSEFLHLVKNN